MSRYGVRCYTCVTVIWEGDDPPDDGQPILTAHADAHCRRPECPHTTQARDQANRSAPVPRHEFDALAARLDALEEKGRT